MQYQNLKNCLEVTKTKMSDKQIENLISSQIHHVPADLWDKVKKDIARTIAENLLATLDALKKPCKQENLDRVDSIIISLIPEQFSEQLLKGA